MQEMNERPVCHRAEDLVTYLYGEAGESDARDFREHLQQCDACRSEFAVFSQVHDSILVWRNEALSPAFNPAAIAVDSAVDSSQFVRYERKLSALAALREFFSVSPLWLRGATAFAGLLLCGLLVWAISRTWQKPAVIANGEPKLYTQSDLNKAIAEAKSQAAQIQQAPASKPDEVRTNQPHRRNEVAISHSTIKPRVKALTREEREQLAADLRLIPGIDDEEFPFVISDQPDQ